MVNDSDYCEKNLSGISWWERIILSYSLFVAQAMHFGQVRRSGARYIEHSQATANQVRELGLPVTAQAVALLHDVIEENKGLRRLLAITLVLFAGIRIACMVYSLTKRSEDEEKYFAQILWWSRLFHDLPAIKLADKMSVLGTPLHRSIEKTVSTMCKVLPGGSFAQMIVDGRKYTRPHILSNYDMLFAQVQQKAQTQLDEALASERSH